MSATIKLPGTLAAEILREAVRMKISEGGPPSQMEKTWSRWAYIAEMFGEHEVELPLDDVYLMTVAGAKQKGLGE